MTIRKGWLRDAVLLAPAISLASVLTGCAGFAPGTAPATATSGATLSGHVFGGQPPVSGSHVYLYAAGNGGYGSASTSLLTGGTVDSSGNAYVTTDTYGAFTITAGYTCPSATAQVYLLAAGGNPGLAAGTSNNAITMLAAVGNCGSLTATTNIVINEVSTAAAVTALQQFMVDVTHIGTSSTNATGMANAFASVADLVTLATGMARTAPAAASGTSPQAKLNTIADILAPCINSASNASSTCTGLFAAAQSTGTTAPTEVAGAMLLIAQKPGSNASARYQQINAAAPFQPMLSATPNDLTLGVTYSGGGLTNPGSVVIDAAGSAWMANCPTCNGAAGTDSIVGFGPQGAVLSGAAGYTASIHKPQGLAFDPSGNLWSDNLASGAVADQVVKMNAGAVSSGFPYAGSTLSSPYGIALDAAGNAWVTNQGLHNAVKISATGATSVASVTSNGFYAPLGIGIDGTGSVYAAGTGSSSILKFDSTGTVLSGSGSGYTGAGLSAPLGIAIDNAPHVWTVDNGSNAVSELSGTGAAVSPGSGYQVGLYQAAVIAIDGLGSAWIANCRAGCSGSGSTQPDNIIHVAANGSSVDASDGLQNTGFAAVGTTAIDASGNLWVTNNTGGSVTKLLGVAGPVRTPLAVAAAANALGTRP